MSIYIFHEHLLKEKFQKSYITFYAFHSLSSFIQRREEKKKHSSFEGGGGEEEKYQP
jgi:hypothetical protein